MDKHEQQNHSFIVRIWLERPAQGRQAARWRGQITHVPGGERRYLRDLNGLNAFVESYLEVLGIPPRLRTRLRRWLRLLHLAPAAPQTALPLGSTPSEDAHDHRS